jgi:cysteine desulfurase family protein (TIGR01976 family)
MPLDLGAIRRQFPGLDRPWVFFDNAGGSQILGRAVESIVEFLTGSNVQLGGTYAVSELAALRVAEGARALARWIGCDASEVVIGTSTTQILSNLALAMAAELAPGDEIVVTDVDHEANIGCWRRMAAVRGLSVVEWRVDRTTHRLRIDDLERLLTPRTRLCCFTHASNLVGSIHPVAEIAKLCHARGVRVCVDGVAYAPHRPLDVRGWDVDYYAFSVYKVYGPHLAALYGKRELLAGLRNINHFFIGDELPYKLMPGHVPYELAHALPAVVDYLTSLDFAAVAAHEGELTARLLELLRGARGVTILGEAEPSPTRLPTISFTVAGRHGGEIVRAVDPHHIGIKHGDFYARRLVDALGLGAQGGVVRVSMVHYNTLDEVDRLIGVLSPILSSTAAPTT